MSAKSLQYVAAVPGMCHSCCLRVFLGLQGGAEGLAGQNDPAWALPLGAVVLGVRHMGLSGWQAAECMAIENELTAWQDQGDFKSQEPALR